MALLDRIRRRLAVLARRGRFQRELEEEMQAHLAFEAEENEANGMTAEEARYAARRRFGNATSLVERSRDAWGWTWVEGLAQDLRYALRTMRRSPGLTAAAVVSLALGIGADTALVSAMDAFWFRPLPGVREPGALVRVFTRTQRIPNGDTAYADYSDMAQASQTVELAASERRGPFLGVNGVVESTWTELVSDNYFSVLGVRARLGRMFRRQRQAEPALVISDGLWRRRFGADPHVVGRTVDLNGRPFVVLGVAPKEFRGIELWTDIDLWVPMSAWGYGEETDREAQRFSVVGRLHPGATLAQAGAEMSSLARALAAAYPKTNKGRDAAVVTEFRYHLAQGGVLAAIFAAIMAMLLLIACANVANLLLARNEARRRELAVRLAIGCGRRRLVRQLLTESFLLAAMGAAAALVLAAWLIRALPRILPPDRAELRLDHRVLLFTLFVAAFTALLFGLAPALRSSRPALTPDLKDEAITGGRRWFALGDGLVVAQMALSLVLLASAGLLVRSFLQCLRLDLGFDRKDVLIVRMVPGLPEPQARVFYRQAVERTRALPGVRQVGLVRRAPLWPSEGGAAVRVSFPGDRSTSYRFRYTTAGVNYFRTMGIPVMRGRAFDEHDNAAGAPAAIVNETLARRFWPGENPTGHILLVGGERKDVVGVVKDTKVNAVLEAPEPYLYLPFGQDFSYTMSLVIETSGDPMRLVGPVKSCLAALVKMPPPDMATLESLIFGSTSDQRSMVTIVSGLGVLGLLLTAAGLYGVMSSLVARRTREIGIRVALGATRRDAIALVLRRAVGLAGAGAAIGLPGALMASAAFASALYGINPRDPLTLALACLVLLSVAVLASLAPAARASRTMPAEALRHD